MTSRAGLPAEESDLIDVDELIAAYYDRTPNPEGRGERVVFGTSGHRGSSLSNSFNENHILATTQAIVDYRDAQGITGPLFLGRDTHALSLPAERSAIEVLLANGIDVRVDSRDSWVPTPALSHAILTYNRGKAADDPSRADGIVVTPSHNPPRDGAASSTTRRTADPPTPTPRAGSPTARTPSSPAASRCEAGTLRRHRLGFPHRLRLPRRLRARPAVDHRHRRHPLGRSQHRRRPARWSLRRVLGADRGDARPRPHGREPRGRPDLALHDPGLGREDPDGSVVAFRDGPRSVAKKGSYDVLTRQRRRRRPARHRDP